jgi:hypothetical protein
MADDRQQRAAFAIRLIEHGLDAACGALDEKARRGGG